MSQHCFHVFSQEGIGALCIPPLDGATLALDLGNIQAGDLQTVLFQYIRLNLLIGCALLEAGLFSSKNSKRIYSEPVSPLESKATVSTPAVWGNMSTGRAHARW